MKQRLLWPGAGFFSWQPCSPYRSRQAGIWDEGNIENGQALFNANCASCHLVTNEVLAAPASVASPTAGAGDEILVQWIQNPPAAATGDPCKSLVDRYVGTYG